MKKARLVTAWHICMSILLISFVAATAHSDIITQTENFSGIPNLFPSLTFEQFNDMGGAYTLDSIEVSFNLDINGGFLVISQFNSKTCLSKEEQFIPGGVAEAFMYKIID